MTTTLRLKPIRSDIEKAADIIAGGGLVAFPTETVYGLGANALDPEAVANIYKVKGRPSDNPTIVHIEDEEALSWLATGITPAVHKLIDRFWPGPMTIIVNRTKIVPDVTTGGLDTVGIRMPENKVAHELIRLSGCPIAAPSANISGKPSPTMAYHVLQDMEGCIEAVIDGGSCSVGIESTIIDLTGDTPIILRPGIITHEEISEVLGEKVMLDPALNQVPSGGSIRPKAPGMKYKHYAPNAEMIIFAPENYLDGREAERFIRKTTSERQQIKALLMNALHEERNAREKKGQKVFILETGKYDRRDTARNIFAQLREADKMNADVILTVALPQCGIGFSIMNRLLKSAGFNLRYVKTERLLYDNSDGK